MSLERAVALAFGQAEEACKPGQHNLHLDRCTACAVYYLTGSTL